MNPPQPSVFERHPKTTLAVFWLAFLLLFAGVAELGLKYYSGMGRPVLFYRNPSFGYRLLPNQETWRFEGAHFKINNLGLRAQDDWNADPRKKILFLGDSVTYGGNHISNEDLFSAVAARDLDAAGFQSGNAGIPNWGVENVYGLVVREKFLPASIYVTTFIEDDFYRGLQQGRNKPWIKYKQPDFALEELAEWIWYKYIDNPAAENRRELEKVPADVRVERAAAHLEEMDAFIKAHGYPHLIFISPTRQETLGERPLDARVKAALDRHGVHAVYLIDSLRARHASDDEIRSWYHDNDHLTAKGHALWGELMRGALASTLPPGALPRAG